jgi:hypothetical protein
MNTTLKDALRSEILLATGYANENVIMANQSFGVPAKPYSTMFFASQRFLHQSESYWREPSPDVFERVVDQVKETTVRIQVFGEDNSPTSAFDMVSTIYAHFLKDSTIERLDQNGIKIINAISQPQDVSQQISGTDYEYIAFMDTLFRQKLEVVESLEPVETLEYTGTIDDADTITDNVSI